MNFFLKFLYRKEIDANAEYISNLKYENYVLSKSIEDTEYLMKEYSKLLDFILKYSSNSIYKIVKDKSDSYIFVVKEEMSNSLAFLLYSLEYRHLVPRLYTRKMSKGLNNESYYLYIDDILVSDQDKGLGSILMESLIEYAKNNGYVCIRGWLSPIDKEHFDKLEHFYKKFGFEIKFRANKESGSIKLKL